MTSDVPKCVLSRRSWHTTGQITFFFVYVWRFSHQSKSEPQTAGSQKKHSTKDAWGSLQISAKKDRTVNTLEYFMLRMDLNDCGQWAAVCVIVIVKLKAPRKHSLQVLKESAAAQILSILYAMCQQSTAQPLVLRSCPRFELLCSLHALLFTNLPLPWIYSVNLHSRCCWWRCTGKRCGDSVPICSVVISLIYNILRRVE